MIRCKKCDFVAKGRNQRSQFTRHQNKTHRVYSHKNNNTEQIAAAIVDAALKPTDYASGYRDGFRDDLSADERAAANKRVASYIRS